LNQEDKYLMLRGWNEVHDFINKIVGGLTSG
jgi:hypothetical protein